MPCRPIESGAVIDGLIGGKLCGKPIERSGRNGPFVTAKVRAVSRNGDSVFVNVIAFADAAVSGLLALEDGDAVSLAGELAVKVWTDKVGEARPSLDMVAHSLMTAYHVSRKREAVDMRDTERGIEWQPESEQGRQM